jgi:uncharacterized integral membrane protein
MRLIKTLLVAIFFIVAITFALQNQQSVTLHYYGLIPPFSVPVFLLVFVAILLGILITGLGDIFVRYALRMRARSCEKEWKRCQKELETMKQAQQKAAYSPGQPEKEPSQKDLSAEGTKEESSISSNNKHA